MKRQDVGRGRTAAARQSTVDDTKGARSMSETLENLLQETRRFEPPAALAADANVTADAYERATEDRLGFWDAQARRPCWAREWDQGLGRAKPASPKWVVGGH